MTTLTTRDVPQSSALAVASSQGYWSETQLAALKQIGVGNASSGDLAVFLNFAQQTGLDPFARQIYMISRWTKDGEKWTIQASIDGLRIVAQRSRVYAGQTPVEWCGPDGVWRDVWLESGSPAAARVGVLRTGFAQPLYAVALFAEYAAVFTDKKTGETKFMGLWATKPAVMIAKCAEALALRKAFPMDLSGLYTPEEVERDDLVVAVQVEQQEKVRPATERRGAREEVAEPTEGRDWLADVEAATSAEQLRAIYNEARNASGVPDGLAEKITAKGQALTAPPADEVVDAEIVDDEAADAAWLASQTA